MAILLWGVAGGLLGLGLYFLVTRGRRIDQVMHQMGSVDERAAWRRPSASVWDESKSKAEGDEEQPPPEA